jgi:hypothetical protein
MYIVYTYSPQNKFTEENVAKYVMTRVISQIILHKSIL